MFIVCDYTGVKISQYGDVNVGGEILLCKLCTMPQKKVSTKYKLCTLWGLMLLNGIHFMCVLIITGFNNKTNVDMGIDLFV